MFYARSSGGAEARDPSSRLGSSSSTCSFSTYPLKGELGKGLEISGGSTEKSIGGSRVTIEQICGSSGKSYKTEEVDREAQK